MQSNLSGTILVVEDETGFQRFLTTLLSDSGFNVIRAFAHGEALQRLRGMNPPSDLAIVDIELPTSFSAREPDGLAVLKELRARRVYAIVVSGYISDHIDEILGDGVCDIVDKIRFKDQDFNEEFISKIREALEQAEADRRAEGKMPEQQHRLRQLPSTLR